MQSKELHHSWRSGRRGGPTDNMATCETAFDVEIVLKERDYAVTEHIVHTGNEPGGWPEEEVEAVLSAFCRAMSRETPPAAKSRYVALRGFSWIVEPAPGGVVIAIEI